MASRPKAFRPRGQHAAPLVAKRYDQERRETKAGRAWYSLALWRGPSGLRAQQLAREPLCERCLGRGEVVAADTVNHRQPHAGSWTLFIDPDNHESLCASCHSSDVQREEGRQHRAGGV